MDMWCGRFFMGVDVIWAWGCLNQRTFTCEWELCVCVCVCVSSKFATHILPRVEMGELNKMSRDVVDDIFCRHVEMSTM